MNEQETVLLDSFCGDLGLEIVFAGKGALRCPRTASAVRDFSLRVFSSISILPEFWCLAIPNMKFLRDLPQKTRRERIKKLLSYHDIPCIILSRDLPVLQELIEEARLTGVPILRTDRITTAIMNDLFFYLNKKLAPQTTMHGVLMDVSGVGILLTGHSGVGKSETAMELIKRGHRLVADDSVIIKKVSESLVGTSPEMIRYFMELRGIGIINIKNMYGSGSILNEKEIELVMELENWEEGKTYDRLGEGTLYETILGVKVMKHVIPVKPGRNLSIIIEVAARNFRLKSMGYDAAQELIGRTIGQ